MKSGVVLKTSVRDLRTSHCADETTTHATLGERSRSIGARCEGACHTYAADDLVQRHLEDELGAVLSQLCILVANVLEHLLGHLAAIMYELRKIVAELAGLASMCAALAQRNLGLTAAHQIVDQSLHTNVSAHDRWLASTTSPLSRVPRWK